MKFGAGCLVAVRSWQRRFAAQPGEIMAKMDGGGKARQGDGGGKVQKHRGARGVERVERPNWVAMDVHCGGTEGGWTDHAGVEGGRFRCATAIPELKAELEKMPRPRVLAIEEGPLADWLYRQLSPLVDRMIVCDPHRNALVAKEGDKDDPIDWRKLAALLRGGFLKPVHHADCLGRALFKQRVQLYHDRVPHRVREALRVIWFLRRFGVFAREKDLADEATRAALLGRLPQEPSPRQDLELLLEGYDLAAEQVVTMRRRLVESSRAEGQVRRFTELPGVAWVRAATFFAFIDTPWRFKSKQALWKYCGIGLERRHSGGGPVLLRVPKRCNRTLKCVLLGAAKSAAAAGDNPFADLYERWLREGCSPRVARRNTARALAAVMWGMFKSGNAYEPKLVGTSPREPSELTRV
jgi:transposase